MVKAGTLPIAAIMPIGEAEAESVAAPPLPQRSARREGEMNEIVRARSGVQEKVAVRRRRARQDIDQAVKRV